MTGKPHGPFIQTRPMLCDFCKGACGSIALPGIKTVAQAGAREFYCFVICASCAGYIAGPHGSLVEQ